MRFVLPNISDQMEQHLDNIDRTYDSNHCSIQVRLDHWANFEEASNDIVDEMGHQLK